MFAYNTRALFSIGRVQKIAAVPTESIFFTPANETDNNMTSNRQTKGSVTS